jgi:hypothetical protein
VLRPADIGASIASFLVASLLVLSAAVARADSERLIFGTHDAALASALSVAVSPRGLSVVELPEPLGNVADVPEARRLIAVPGTVAVVWLCDDDAGAHALCFCDRDGRLSVKPISVASPLSPPDAAAVALSVKMLLGAPVPPPAPAPPPPPAPSRPPAPISTPRAALPAFVVGVMLGARVQSTAEPHASARFGLEGVFAPAAFERVLALGVALGTGTALAAGGPAPGTAARPMLSDLTLGLTARGRVRLQAPWLELALGPSAHVLSGAGAPQQTELSLDAQVSANLPIGPTLVGARVGGFAMLTSPTASDTQLPRWNGEALLTFGLVLR